MVQWRVFFVCVCVSVCLQALYTTDLVARISYIGRRHLHDKPHWEMDTLKLAKTGNFIGGKAVDNWPHIIHGHAFTI